MSEKIKTLTDSKNKTLKKQLETIIKNNKVGYEKKNNYDAYFVEIGIARVLEARTEFGTNYSYLYAGPRLVETSIADTIVLLMINKFNLQNKTKPEQNNEESIDTAIAFFQKFAEKKTNKK